MTCAIQSNIEIKHFTNLQLILLDGIGYNQISLIYMMDYIHQKILNNLFEISRVIEFHFEFYFTFHVFKKRIIRINESLLKFRK